MRLLVYGCNGFIGAAICAQARREGHDVLGCGLSETSDFESYIPWNMATPAKLKAFDPDAVIYAAGSASVPKSFVDTAHDFKANVEAVSDILNLLRQLKKSVRFLLLSSAAVYGHPIRLPVLESDPLAPISPYGFHKLMAENLCALATTCFDQRTAVLRIFSAYGPGLRRQVLWDICNKSAVDAQLSIQGDGSETRDFIHVSDVASAALLVLNAAPMNGEAYNVATGQESRVCDLAEHILREISPSKAIQLSGILPSGTPVHWCANIEKLQSLGFKPQVEFKHGVQEYIDWWKSNAS